MSKRNVTIVAVLAVSAALLLAGATTASAKGRAAREARGLRALGLQAYWSLLREDQKPAARAILGEHLAATAPDRLAAAARLLRFKADVAALLTTEQRKAAARLAQQVRGMSQEDRRDGFDGLLDQTDREALARRAEARVTATPEERVALGLEMLDQMYALVEPTLAERLTLTQEQRTTVRALYEALKTDLQPVGVRLEVAKAEAARAGVALLDAEQKAKFEAFVTDVRERVLGFLRGA